MTYYSYINLVFVKVTLTVLVDKLVKSLENEDYVVGVFLDFSKAFDTIDHEILLAKITILWDKGNSLKVVHKLFGKSKTICYIQWSQIKNTID